MKNNEITNSLTCIDVQIKNKMIDIIQDNMNHLDH